MPLEATTAQGHPKLCGARTRRTGLPCPQLRLPGKRRCYHHGGISRPGLHPRNVAPAERAKRLLQARHRALGLPWYGGAPRKPQKVRSLVDQAKETVETSVALLTEAHELVPAGSAGSKLSELALKGLDRLEQIIDLPLDETDPKQMRLVGDMALGVCKLFQRAAEGAFKAQQGSALVALLEALKEAQAKKD